MKDHSASAQGSASEVTRERVIADMAALAADAEALLRATADDASDKARETRARLTAALENAKATYQDFQAQGLEAAKAAVSKADETIRAHPYESIGIAFGVGILLGALLRRK
jgi:ElaB/YqjD/DUF883 family membrane-anchored ribosome-binding protein